MSKPATSAETGDGLGEAEDEEVESDGLVLAVLLAVEGVEGAGEGANPRGPPAVAPAAAPGPAPALLSTSATKRGISAVDDIL